MKRLSVPAALVAAAIAVPLGLGSSHREAPNTLLDPAADETDLYAFTAPDAPGSLTVVANWIPFQEPAGGPNFYPFDPKARYYVNVDNTGDGVYDVRYRFDFRSRYLDRRRTGSLAYATPQVTSLNDPELNFRQTYDVTRETYRRGRRRSARRIAGGVPAVPSNVGPKTMPNYAALADEGIRPTRGGGRVFAGQRDDPFFIDLGVTFDSVNFRPGTGTGNQGGGKDDLANFNVNSIVLQVPERHVTRNRRAATNPSSVRSVVGVWASTERRRLEVTNSSRRGRGHFTQVSRLGNPLVNELIIPVARKDEFNRTQPRDDARRYGRYVLRPELARAMNALFPGVINAPERDRTDIVQAVLQGIPNLNQQRRGTVPAVDTLKINLATPPSGSPSRFAVLANDLAGYPNGRRLTDDVVDIDLRVVAGFLKGNRKSIGDGVDQNDKPFLTRFPYAALPTSGFDSVAKRTEAGHGPDPADPAGP